MTPRTQCSSIARIPDPKSVRAVLSGLSNVTIYLYVGIHAKKQRRNTNKTNQNTEDIKNRISSSIKLVKECDQRKQGTKELLADRSMIVLHCLKELESTNFFVHFMNNE